jgi:hypothetical protein
MESSENSRPGLSIEVLTWLDIAKAESGFGGWGEEQLERADCATNFRRRLKSGNQVGVEGVRFTVNEGLPGKEGHLSTVTSFLQCGDPG